MLSVFFCIMIGVVQGSRTSLRGKDEPSSTNRKNIVTMDDVDAELERLFANNEQGNARKLDNTCWHGGQAGDDLTWLVSVTECETNQKYCLERHLTLRPQPLATTHPFTGKKLGIMQRYGSLFLWNASVTNGVFVSGSLSSQLWRLLRYPCGMSNRIQH